MLRVGKRKVGAGKENPVCGVEVACTITQDGQVGLLGAMVFEQRLGGYVVCVCVCVCVVCVHLTPLLDRGHASYYLVSHVLGSQ